MVLRSRFLIFFAFLLLDSRPEGSGSTSGGLTSSVECAAQGNEFFEGSVDTVALDVAVKETPDLIFRQSAAGGLDGFADTVGDGVPGGHAEEEGGTGVAAIPYGKGSLEMG